MEEKDFKAFEELSKIGIADSCLILSNEQKICINIIFLIKIIKFKARQMLFLSYNPLTEVFAHIIGITVEGGVTPTAHHF